MWSTFHKNDEKLVRVRKEMRREFDLEKLRRVLEEENLATVDEEPGSGAAMMALSEKNFDEFKSLCVAGVELVDSVLYTALYFPEALKIALTFAENVPQYFLSASAAANLPESFDVLSAYFQDRNLLVAAAATPTEDGFCALHAAAVGNYTDVFKVAAKYKECYARSEIVDATTTKSEQTALHKACRYGFYSATKYLLRDLGASPHCFDANGRQPAHVAASRGYSRILCLLLHFGASPTVLEKRHHRSPSELCFIGSQSRTKAKSTNSRSEIEDYEATAAVLASPPLPDHCVPNEYNFPFCSRCLEHSCSGSRAPKKKKRPKSSRKIATF